MARPTPLWLGDLLAAVMIATAVYCAARIVYARVRNRATHRDVDGLHVLMGIAMTGMLTTHLSALTPMRGGLHAFWVTVFALGVAWFGYRALRDRGRASTHGNSMLIHVVGSAAMLYMLLAAGSGGMPGMGGAGGSVRLPEVGVLLGVAATGAAVLVLDRLGPAATAPAPAGAGTGGQVRAIGTGARRVLAPRAAECCHLAMCVTTAYMLLAMFT